MDNGVLFANQIDLCGLELSAGMYDSIQSMKEYVERT